MAKDQSMDLKRLSRLGDDQVVPSREGPRNHNKDASKPASLAKKVLQARGEM